MQALDALNKKDLTEIKSYPKPPYKVEMVMEAVMVLKKVEPTWAEAKRQLGDVEFLNKVGVIIFLTIFNQLKFLFLFILFLS